MIKLQNEGKLEEAWEIMKHLPSFKLLMEKDPVGMQKLWDANEAGYYQDAFVCKLYFVQLVSWVLKFSRILK